MNENSTLMYLKAHDDEYCDHDENVVLASLPLFRDTRLCQLYSPTISIPKVVGFLCCNYIDCEFCYFCV